MWEGSYPSRTRESVFSWEVVAGWTAQLIDKKEYFIQTDIPRLPRSGEPADVPFLILRRFSSQPGPRVRPNHPFSLTRLCPSR
mgnify:CR=1 FL=1